MMKILERNLPEAMYMDAAIATLKIPLYGAWYWYNSGKRIKLQSDRVNDSKLITFKKNNTMTSCAVGFIFL